MTEEDFLSWSERTLYRCGELDSTGLMILGYCIGVLRGGHLALVPEEARKDGYDVPDDAAEDLVITLIRNTIQQYGQLHEGNAALIHSIIQDWGNDEEAT